MTATCNTFSFKRFWIQKTCKVFKEGRQTLDHAKKVLHYRKDILPENVVQQLLTRIRALELLITHYDSSAKEAVREQSMDLKAFLKEHGGRLYPVGFISENVEMLVVGAIVAIGFRAFFFQPFQIPTNSMYPSYYGMTEVIYDTPQAAPQGMEKLVRWLFIGANHYEVLAPATGELVAYLTPPNAAQKGGFLTYDLTRAEGLMGILPDPVRQYTFSVMGKSVTLKAPLEYNLDHLFIQTFFPENPHPNELLEAAFKAGKIKRTPQGYAWFTGIQVKTGQPILNFDILAGDRLFVDRMTYNFRAPEVGDAIVFYTRKIKGLQAPDGTPDDRFYIKRLVGLPGDTLEIRAPALFRNGEPIKGAKAFGKNSTKKGLFPGYINRWDMGAGQTITVGDGYYALGDNSPGSLDSRQWGLVPPKEVIGRAVFIYYPFTSRWGVSD
jgi:signal peptidase I